MNKLDKALTVVPISVNLITVIIGVLMISRVIDVPYDYNMTPYDRLSYGIYEITNTVFTLLLGVLCFRFKFCFYNWVSVASLLFMNIINLLGLFTNMGEIVYYFAFESVIVLSLTILSIILYIVELKKPKKL